MFGFLIVDKPKGLTSYDVVEKIKLKVPKRIKVGHTGTLDPLATGVLIVAVGRATRLSEYLLKREKSYVVEGIFGYSSETYDIDGELKKVECPEVPRESLTGVLKNFTGTIKQVPPPFSAIRIKGKRAYQLAREGKKVQLPEREVTIYKLELLEYSYPKFKLFVRCSSGTYIRSLIHDLGRALSCDAVVSELRRVCIGNICEKEAVPLELIEKEGVEKFLKKPDEILGFPKVKINEIEKRLFLNGGFLVKNLPSGMYSVLSESNRFLGVAVSNGEVLKPKKVIN
jgi:tRNA pseudouridine55 synthase